MLLYFLHTIANVAIKMKVAKYENTHFGFCDTVCCGSVCCGFVVQTLL